MPEEPAQPPPSTGPRGQPRSAPASAQSSAPDAQATAVHPIPPAAPRDSNPQATAIHSAPIRLPPAPPATGTGAEPALDAAVEEAARTWKKTSSRLAKVDDAAAPSDSKTIAEAFRRTTSKIAERVTTDLRVPSEAREKDGTPRRVARYELREALGSGGCGTVFKAWDPRHERFVALKLVHRVGEHDRARFEREVKTTARLSHPSIVALLDSGAQDDALFLVMELVDGASLDARVDRGTITHREIVSAVRDAAIAVHHAHGQGVLHRDLKPHNIMVDQTGRGRVTDFGLALVAGIDQRLTQTGSIVGTPAYMPPEQVSAQVLDARTDVYSLGATLYHGLAKEPPFETTSIEELFLSILRSDVQSPCSHDATIPADLATVCLRALEKEPDRRYPTAKDLADELQRWLDGEPILARPPTSYERALRWSQRNPMVVVLSATTMLLAIALAALIIHDAMRP